MNYIGVDLHKQTITVCVVNQQRQILRSRTLACDQPDEIAGWFSGQQPFAVGVEATTGSEWFLQLIEPFADRIVLAHPTKLRIIAESTRKSDRLDARVLAEFLALDMIPPAHRATPREREHRRLMRHRHYLRRRLSSVMTRMRHLLATCNADRPDLFSQRGRQASAALRLSAAERFALDQMWAEYDLYRAQLQAFLQALHDFVKTAPPAEAGARRVLRTIPGVGPLTTEVFLSEIADVRRFSSQKKVAAYAGLAPGQRESAGHRRELGITHQGSAMLRWSLSQAAWQLVRWDTRWRRIFEAIAKRRGRKKAIVAITRRLLCMMVAVVQRQEKYRPPENAPQRPEPPAAAAATGQAA